MSKFKYSNSEFRIYFGFQTFGFRISSNHPHFQFPRRVRRSRARGPARGAFVVMPREIAPVERVLPGARCDCGVRCAWRLPSLQKSKRWLASLLCSLLETLVAAVEDVDSFAGISRDVAIDVKRRSRRDPSSLRGTPRAMHSIRGVAPRFVVAGGRCPYGSRGRNCS